MVGFASCPFCCVFPLAWTVARSQLNLYVGVAVVHSLGVVQYYGLEDSVFFIRHFVVNLVSHFCFFVDMEILYCVHHFSFSRNMNDFHQIFHLPKGVSFFSIQFISFFV